MAVILGPRLGDKPLDVLKHVLAGELLEGVALEFGVAAGTSTRLIADRMPTVGFDSFEGLPEDWRPGFSAGTFAGAPPEIDGAELVVGLFEDTVPSRLPSDIGFIHIDCDLYSSTKTILNNLPPLEKGVVIQFDELFGYPGWPVHEFRALMEWLSESGVPLEVIGYVPSSEQISFRVA